MTMPAEIRREHPPAGAVQPGARPTVQSSLEPGTPWLMASPVPFAEGLRQRHQGLAEAFARAGLRVTYVDPLQSPGWSLQRHRHSDNLEILTLSVPFRAARFPFLHRLPALLALGRIRRRLPQPLSRTHLWIADPSLACWVSRVPWRSVIYDRCDLHGAFPGQTSAPWQTYETTLWQHSTAVFATSKALLSPPPGFATPAHLLPNALAPEWLARPARQTGSSVPSQPLRILSSGAHFEWIDFPLLTALAETPGLELHIAGSGRGEYFARLIALPGVRYHGRLPQNALVQLYDSCHIGIIPFKDLPLTRAVDPVKIYEYAGRGLEVWVSDVPGLRDHPLADRLITSGALSRLSPTAVSTPRTARPAGSLPTWNDRVHTVFEVLRDTMADQAAADPATPTSPSSNPHSSLGPGPDPKPAGEIQSSVPLSGGR